MRKTQFILYIICIFILVGCAEIKESGVHISGVTRDEDYQKYHEYLLNDQITEDGYYKPAEEAVNQYDLQQVQNQNLIHVTFAENPHLAISYYLDENLTKKIDISNCLLEPGKSIYASEVKNLDPDIELYHFTGFEVWKYTDDKSERDLLYSSDGNNKLVYQIPEKIEYRDLQIVPVGKYDNRKVNLDAYYIENGVKIGLTRGQWIMNEENKENGTIEADPTKPYRLKYDYSNYSNEKYPFISDPEWYYDNTINHTVIFNEVMSGSKEIHYAIEFRNYRTIKFVYDNLHFPLNFTNRYNLEIRYDGNDYPINITRAVSLNSNESFTFEKKVRGGDRLLITVPNDIRLSSADLKINAATKVENGYQYDLVIPETPIDLITIYINRRDSTNQLWSSKELTHGTLEIRTNYGGRLADGDELPFSDDRIIAILNADNGYYINGAKDDFKTYTQEINFSELDQFLINHPIKKYITIYLNDSSELGTCTFILDGSPVKGKTYARSDQTLSVNFELNSDSDYKINRPNDISNLIGNIFSSEKISIRIPLDFDGNETVNLNCMDFVELTEK